MSMKRRWLGSWWRWLIGIAELERLAGQRLAHTTSRHPVNLPHARFGSPLQSLAQAELGKSSAGYQRDHDAESSADRKHFEGAGSELEHKDCSDQRDRD